jgi:hypothetical protein
MSDILDVEQSAENPERIENAPPEECMLGSGGKFRVEVLRTGSVQNLNLFGRVTPANMSGDLVDRSTHYLQLIC